MVLPCCVEGLGAIKVVRGEAFSFFMGERRIFEEEFFGESSGGFEGGILVKGLVDRRQNVDEKVGFIGDFPWDLGMG